MAILRQSSFRHSSLLCLSTFLVLLASVAVNVHAANTDADILLQFQAEVNATFSGWSLANVDNMCINWSGVSCTDAGRVSILNINPDAGAPVISARFPSVLAGLTSLVTFNAPNQNLWGLFPKEIFQFPNLTAINLKGTPVTIEWPTSAASQLINDMNLDGTNITTPMTDVFAWDRLTSFDLRRTQVRCPLPQGLVDRWSQQANNPALFATYTLFEITNNRLCDQIDMVRIPAAISSVYGVKSAAVPPLTYTAVHKNIHLEFYDHEVRIFGLLKSGAVWREDYFSLNIPALVPWDSTRLSRMSPFAITPFKSVSWTIPEKQLTATATLTNLANQVMETQLIFEFDRDDGNININGATLKFSYIARNVNATFAVNNVLFQMIAGYHTQISEPGSTPIFCGAFSGQQVACQSSVSNVTFELEVGLGTFTTARIGVRNTKIDLSFGYGLNGTRDGHDLWAQPNPADLGAERYWHKLGFSDFTDKYHRLGLQNQLPRTGPANDQSLQLVVTLDNVPFNELIYDPDISLSLIFDTSSDFVPSAGPLSTGALANVSNNDVAIATGFAAAIIVAAGVIVAVVLWQRRRSATVRARDTIARRLATTTNEPASTETPAPAQAQSQADFEKEGRKNSKWQKSTLRSVRVTNFDNQ